MRSIRPAVGVCLCFALILSTSAQQSTGPQRDAQAVAILTQCLSAAGGSPAVSAGQDFPATGAITYNWASPPLSGPVTVFGKRLPNFRLDPTVSTVAQHLL